MSEEKQAKETKKKLNLAPCPYDKAQCPGTRKGCGAWGGWQEQSWEQHGMHRKQINTPVEGCRVLKLKAEELAI